MEENRQEDILNLVLSALDQEGLWFTTKEDKLYANAKNLYKLDVYGELEDKSKERLVKEVEEYFGNGATFLTEAVEQWIQDNLVEGIIGYVDTLAMNFEIPEISEEVEAHSEEGVDDLKTDEEPKEEELGTEVKLEESKDEKLEEAKYLIITRDKDYISNKKNIKELTATYGKGKFQIYDSNGTLIHPEGIYDGEDRIWASTFIKTHKVGDEVPDAADWYYHEYEPKEEKQMSESKKITESRKASGKKTLKENARKRLDERNEQSADIIAKALAEITPDTNEKESGIINKTSELFNELSEKNYDVQVAFDNGESQLQIDIGQQGASAMITITDANQPIRTFISGNFELTDENIRAIQDLKEVLS